MFSSTSSNVGWDFHLSEQSVLKRFTVLDIGIIDVLMKNVFTSIKKLAEALGGLSSRIVSHVGMLGEYKVFNGFFIRRYPIKPLGKLALGSVSLSSYRLGRKCSQWCQQYR